MGGLRGAGAWRGVMGHVLGLLCVLALTAASWAQGTGALPGGGGAPAEQDREVYAAGQPWAGAMGITETVDEIMARDRGVTPKEGMKPKRVWPAWMKNKPLAPGSPLVATWPPLGEGEAVLETLAAPQAIGTSFKAAGSSESGFVPPDTMGDVGPTQILVGLNGRIKVFSRLGVLGALNTTLDNFFASVRNGSSISDPQVRFDRLTQRWFVLGINIANTSNRVVLAVSSGATITGTGSFTFFQFTFDAVGTTPNVETGMFLDYPSMGVDANAIYTGGNVFTSGVGTFDHTSAYVIRKSSVIGAGPIVVTAFRNLGNLGTPRGVDNDDPAATQGYIIGDDASAFGRLIIRRISTPGATPAISANILLTVPATTAPQNVTVMGSTLPISASTDRVFQARAHRLKSTGVTTLWCAQNIEVNASGVANTSGNRNGARWYQIQNLTGTPSLVQSGTLFDSAATNPRSYIFPAVTMTGQGHMALGASFGGAADRLGVVTAGRLATDTLGTIQTPTTIMTGSANYNQGDNPERWGDYSYTVRDPLDDMTMWTFQEYCDATNAWAVRATQLRAPPPATPAMCVPNSVTQGDTGVNVTLTGNIAAGSGFFDPHADYTNHISAAVPGGGVTVNSVTFISATQVTLNLTVDGAAATGSRLVSVTNPDGQTQISAIGILTVNPGTSCPGFSAQPGNQVPCVGGIATFSVTATGNPAPTFQWKKDGNPIDGATSSTLTINPVSAGDVGSYVCTATNSCGSADSNAATLTLGTAPGFTSHPGSVTTCVGGSASFSVSVDQSATFQWRKDGNPIGGATGPTYSIAVVGAGDQGSYDCVATSTCGSTTSNAASLTVNSGATFTQHPATQTVCVGTSVTLTIATDIVAGVGYQWRKNTVNIPGAVGASFTIASPVTGDSGSYDCVATNLCGTATSNAASLTVNAGPVITAEPQNAAACAGGSVSLTVAASPTGTPQWRKEGIEIPGANGFTYTINPVVGGPGGSAGNYDCVVSNACGSATSQTAVVTVNTVAGFDTHPAAQTVCAGAPVSFTISTTPVAGVTYQWRRNSSPIGGATGTTYSIAGAAAGDAGSYDCVATNVCGSVTSNAATLTVNPGPSVTNQPQATSACVGASASFTVAVTPALGASYQWRKDGSPIDGATGATLTIMPVGAGDAASYDCVITNACGTATSNGAALTVNTAPAVTTGPSAASACVGGSVSFSVVASGSPAPGYQWQRNGNPIGGATSATLNISPVAAGDAGSYDCVVTNTCGSDTSAAAALTVDAPPVFTTSPISSSACIGGSAAFTIATNPGVGVTYQWRKNGSPIGGATSSTLSLSPVVAGDAASYDCIATGTCGSTTSTAATLGVFGGPAISGQPTPVTVFSGGTANFGVSITGGTTLGAITYQWRLGGVPIFDGPSPGGGVYSGTATDLLTVSGAGAADAGDFSVVVADSCGSVASDAAALTVNLGNGCPQDFNGDGNVDPDDLGDYLNCFFAAPPCDRADFNGDNNIDPDDLGDFLNVFFGPPC